MKKSQSDKRLKILDQPSYWVEGINSFLYNAILEFMENKGMNQTQLAKHLGISKGRVSQILNDGEINFSIEKIVQLALKLDKYPHFELVDKEDYLKEKESPKSKIITLDYQNTTFYDIVEETYEDVDAAKRSRSVSLYKKSTITQQFALQL